MTAQADKPGSLQVEVVYATADDQWLETVNLEAGATVDDALRAAFSQRLDSAILMQAPAGIWGRVVERTEPVKDGDRVELYRQLQRDPREARREIAAADSAPRERRAR